MAATNSALFVVLTALFLLAGCSGEKEKTKTDEPVRTEFTILKELVKQYAKQTAVGDTNKLVVVERHLKELLESVPDGGQNAAEREILQTAEKTAKIQHSR